MIEEPNEMSEDLDDIAEQSDPHGNVGTRARTGSKQRGTFNIGKNRNRFAKIRAGIAPRKYQKRKPITLAKVDP